jgi:hypothetical protein
MNQYLAYEYFAELNNQRITLTKQITYAKIFMLSLKQKVAEI